MNKNGRLLEKLISSAFGSDEMYRQIHKTLALSNKSNIFNWLSFCSLKYFNWISVNNRFTGILKNRNTEDL